MRAKRMKALEMVKRMRESDERADYFEYSEFDDPTVPGSGYKYISQELVDKLNRVRLDYGLPMRINSGWRSEAHNKAVGGTTNSQHRLGTACDVHCPDGPLQDDLVRIAEDEGFTGIGRYDTFCHLDVRQLPEGDSRVRKWDNRTNRR